MIFLVLEAYLSCLSMKERLWTLMIGETQDPEETSIIGPVTQEL